MKRKHKLLAVLAVLGLVGAQTVYGYWVETLPTAWTLPVTYPVTLVLQGEAEEDAASLDDPEEQEDRETEGQTDALPALTQEPEPSSDPTSVVPAPEEDEDDGDDDDDDEDEDDHEDENDDDDDEDPAS